MKLLERDKITVSFGKFIKEGRDRRGLFQWEVAQELGISQAAYHMIETGKREPSVTMIINICRVLRLDFADYLRTLPKATRPYKRKRDSTPEE